METKWLKEALYGGMTSNAFKLGTVLSLGWFWMRPAGCYTVYKGQDGDIDYDTLLAVMELNDTQVSMAHQDLPLNTIWEYIRRQVSGCGLESADSPSCIVAIDANGDMIGNAPNTPLSVTIEVLSGGRLKLRWRYTKLSEEIAPTGFKIYMDSGSGFDFDTPEATVLYRHGRAGGLEWQHGEFSWISDELVHGQLYKFIVRGYRTGEGETRNTDFVAAAADSVGPAAITDIRATWEDI